MLSGIVFVGAAIARKVTDHSFPMGPGLLGLPRMALVGVGYGVAGMVVFYAWDRMRVVCHLQDPMLGLAVVSAAVIHFVRRRKAFRLRRIFSLVAIVTGLFIAVDYQLCDEFRCHGVVRNSREAFHGPWSWDVHLLWTLGYAASLWLFADGLSALERAVVGIRRPRVKSSVPTISGPLDEPEVGTSDRQSLVKEPTLNPFAHQPPLSRTISYVFWTHTLAFATILAFIWTDFVGGLGKASIMSEFETYTHSGLSCLASGDATCGRLSTYAWAFVITYIIFALSLAHLTVLAESSVFAISVASLAIPLSGVWWSLVGSGDNPYDPLALTFRPAVTGELICSLLGLPIVAGGVAFFFKYNWQESKKDKEQSSPLI